MRCRDFDATLSEYLDTTLPLEQRRRSEEHAAGCPVCSEKLADAQFALDFLRDVPKVEPPPMLVPDILRDTLGVGAVLAAPAGGGRPGLAGWLGWLWQPLVEPRFAMSMAMALLSFSMLTLSGQKAYRAWQDGGVGPLVIVREAGEQIEQVWAEGVEIYETIRLSYQIESEFGASQGDGEAAETPGDSSGATPQPGERP